MRVTVLVAVIAALVSVGSEAQAQRPEPMQVMVLGTYHFDNPGRDINNPKADDVLKPQRQRELEALAAALAEFRPTKIMVERGAKTADLADPNYARFTRGDLLKHRDERVQIGYRIASRLGMNVVYAIDEQSGPGELRRTSANGGFGGGDSQERTGLHLTIPCSMPIYRVLSRICSHTALAQLSSTAVSRHF